MVHSGLIKELRLCASKLSDASKPGIWQTYQHIVVEVQEWRIRAAIALAEVLRQGLLPQHQSAWHLIAGVEKGTGEYRWAENVWGCVLIPALLPLLGRDDDRGIHVAKIVQDQKGRPLGEDGKPLKRNRKGETIGQPARATAINPLGIHKYTEADGVEHWRLRAADYAEVCNKVAEMIEGRDPQECDDGEKLSTPQSPADWARLFKCGSKTFTRWVREKRIRAKKLTTKSYQVHVDDIPKIDRR